MHHMTKKRFDIRHGQKVRLVSQDDRGQIAVGTEGKVLAMTLIGDRPNYLVKWVGKSGPVSFPRSCIELIP